MLTSCMYRARRNGRCASVELAITLDHNLAWAHADAGFIKVLLGRAEEAEADLNNAIRLSPRDPGLDRWIGLLGIADLFLGRSGQR